ncbi:Uu.00g131730.m01.CDS01 [Anthostomella pinea]|uniref:Uu.00g131730.m01.CDS01 n=1 Tax=Anthostomella pinea TaxID=933095 RepID=A0AAI8VIX0_9PEZI|nr:Uu.00g131730.m01.CDS01 [Anthostomella pinea]
MEFFENQVGEVRYLTTLAATPVPVPVSPAESVAHHHSTAAAAAVAERATAPAGAGAKRKSSADDSSSARGNGNGTGTAQQRSKRNRYISIACNECKRRKIKCNGETPCQRCGNLDLQCLYTPNCCSTSVKDSDEFKQMVAQVNQLQEQVETLFSSMSAIRSEALRLAPIQDRTVNMPSAASTPSSSSMTIPTFQRADQPPPRQPGFRGPTSTRFSLDVAKNTLHKMGYSGPGDGIEADGNGNVRETPELSPRNTPHIAISPHKPPPDPLWDFDKDDLIRLCRIYEDEVGIMYPIIRIESVVRHARTLATWMEAAKKNGLAPPFSQDGGISDLNTLLLKVVLCSALLVEEHGSSEKAQRIFDDIRPTTDRMLMSDPANVKNLPILALVAGYYFLSNDEILSWRTMGQVARHCFELGLHRRDAIEKIADEEERRNAIHTFWSAYVLDRRWAFGSGLPYVVPDEEIDPQLPYPEAFPFLIAMINYSKLSARVWRLVRNFDPDAVTELQARDLEDLDQRIKQWYTELPDEARLELPDWEAVPRYLTPQVNSSQNEYDVQRLQIWTYLRLNQIRTWLYTPILHTHSSIMENMRHADSAVKLAKNTIRYLTHLNNATNIYRKLQVFYHQFLSSAITVLFLASCHAPVNFSSSCRDEFYMALELVKDMSSKSWVSKRLWTTIKSLREVAPRLGLAEDPHSTAALTMAGLATGQMRPSPQLDPGYGVPPPVPGSSPGLDGAQAGLQMSSEMSRIFEGYLGKTTQVNDNLAHPDPGSVPPTSVSDGPVLPLGTSGSVYQHFRNMF